MAVFTRIKTWVSNEVLTASDLNGEFNNLLNNTIPASIEDYSTNVSQMQSTADPGGSGTESLATTLAGELQRLRFAIQRIAGSTYWYISPISTLGTGGITTASIANDAITTAKIGDGQVSQDKRVALGQQISSSCGTFTTSSGTLVDVTNLSISISTTGRPVYFGLIYGGGGNSQLFATASGSDDAVRGKIVILRGATTVCDYEFGGRINSAGVLQVRIPPSSVNGVDVVAAGTYTYKVQASMSVGFSPSSIGVNEAKLLVYEL